MTSPHQHDQDPLWAIARAIGKYHYLLWYIAAMLTLVLIVTILGD